MQTFTSTIAGFNGTKAALWRCYIVTTVPKLARTATDRSSSSSRAAAMKWPMTSKPNRSH